MSLFKSPHERCMTSCPAYRVARVERDEALFLRDLPGTLHKNSAATIEQATLERGFLDVEIEMGTLEDSATQKKRQELLEGVIYEAERVQFETSFNTDDVGAVRQAEVDRRSDVLTEILAHCSPVRAMLSQAERTLLGSDQPICHSASPEVPRLIMTAENQPKFRIP